MSEPTIDQAAPTSAALHPVQLHVTDDLQRSRLTVFFRLILAIPHLLWVSLWGIVAFVVVIYLWFRTLFTGVAPEKTHRLLAEYVRYTTHVTAYLMLAANPWPKFFTGEPMDPYPVDVEIAPPARQNRWKVGFRIVLAIPALLLMATLSGGGVGSSSGGGYTALLSAVGIAAMCAFLIWFVAMARGRAPRGLRDLIAWGTGYTAQTYAYLFLLTDRYPYAGPEQHLHDLEPPEREGRPQLVAGGELRRSRLLTFFRLPLAFPHIVWYVLWTVLAVLVAFLNWFCVLALGRAPRPFARFLSAYLRYSTHFNAFVWLVGGPFPGFVGRAGSYPVDLEIEPFGRQHRGITAFRIVLALPVLLLGGAVGGIVSVTGVLSWFVALFRGRVPEGLRNAGAYSLGYTAQLWSYVFLLGDRYPNASPLGTWRAG